MNQDSNDKNSNVKNNTNTGPSSKAPNPKNERPTNNESGSFKAKKGGPSLKESLGNYALNKAINANPALRAAKSGLDAKKKFDNTLNNIRAKKGPQRNPNRSNSNSSTGDSTTENSSTSGADETAKKSLLPKDGILPKPKFLEGIGEDEEGEEESSVSTLKRMFGRGGKKAFQLSPLKVIGFGGIDVKLILLPVVIVAVLFIVILTVVIPGLNNSGLIGIGVADSNEEFGSTEEQKEFQERIKNVQDEYSAEGKNFDAKLIGAVLVILNSYGEGYDYDSMSESEIREIADLMFDESNNYSEELFRENLINDYFPSKIKGKDEEVYKRYVDEMFRLLDAYDKKYTGTDTSTGATGGACTYDIKGMNTEQYKTGIKNENINASGIMVRLMSAGNMCGGVYGQSLGEELVPFEKYVLGVAYAELESVGNQEVKEEAFKAQMVVARSYALTVPFASYASTGRSLKQESGQWILQIDNCVSTQVYCDPDIGCSKNVGEGNQNGVVYSGADKAAQMYKAALPADHKFRQWAAEVAGKIPLDAEGRLYMCNFQQDEQNQMQNLANSGYDYTQIIFNIYPNVKSISESNCTDVTTGDYRGWKQKGQTWSSVVLGGGTDSTKSIGNIGCLATSVAMLVAKSGALTMLPAPTLVTSDTFNPGTFVEALNKSNGFDSAGNFQWNAVGKVIPKFKYQDSLTSELDGMSKENKFNTIKSKVNADKTYCVAEVKGGQGEHWVALDSIEGNTIKMLDPGSNATDLWKEYDWNRTSRINCFTTN